MRTSKFLLGLCLLAGVSCPAVVGAQTILMLTASSTLNSEETARQTQLQSWGFTVNTIVDSSSQATIDAAVAAADAVYVPCTIEDWDLLYKLRTVAKGVVTETPGLDTEFGYATGDGYTQSWNTLENVNNTHAVTSGLSSGSVVIVSSNQNLALNSNTVASGMTVLGTMNWGSMALGVIESGGTLANTYSGNSTASGRRVRLPWGYSFSFSSLNSSGLTLLHNALDWAVAKKLLLHYKLDQSSGTSVTDSSGNGYTGTVTGTATWTTGVRNNCFDFNGSTKIEYNGLLGNPSSFSLACWAYVDATDTSGAEGISLGDYILLRPHDVTNGVALAHFYYGGGSYRTVAATQSYVGTGWHHFVATFDDAGNSFKLYVDGVLVATTSTTSSVSWSGLGTKTRVGTHGNTNTNLDMDGKIDDVRVYNYALSTSEIENIHGFLAHYKLNETSGTSAADSTLSTNNGTVTGTATWVTAMRGNGFDFNGSTYIQATGLFSSPQDLTFATWARVDAVDSSGSELISLGDHAMLRVTSSEVRAVIYDGSSWITTSASYSAVGAGWHHFACTFDDTNDQMKIYVDGSLLTTGSVTSSIGYTGLGSNTLIGKHGNSGTTYDLDGRLDDVRIYNRVLTSSEITALAGYVGYWKLEEASGTTATDSSGAGNNGTFVGSPTLGQAAVYDLGTRFNNATLTEYVSLPKAVINEASTVSASFWFKTTDTGEQAVVSGAKSSQANEFLIHFNSATQLMLFAHGSSQSWTIPSIADGIWHHFAVVSQADTNTTTLYLDNVLIGSRSISAGSTAFTIDTGGLIVAQEQDSVGGSFVTTQCLRGTLDELRLYQRALTTQEIGQLFGLMGRWAFSEGAGTSVADSSGAALNATITDGTWTSDCAGNTALDFDGVNDSAATSSTFDPPNEGAVSLWFRSAGPPAARQRLWGLGGDFEMWQDPDGLVSCDVSTDGYQGGFITTTPLYEADRWYHLVAQYDADTDAYTIYIDGELHKTGVSTWAVTNQSAAVLTFGTRTGSTQYFTGSIRDFRVYNRPMLNSEIALAAGLIGHWQLNESSGTVADDMGVAGNDATYVGSPTLGVDGSNPATNGTAVSLNGTSQYLTTGKSLLSGLSEFTLCAWVRPDSLTPDKSFLGQNGLIELGIDTSSDRIDLWTSAGGSLSSVKQLAIAKWSHVAAVGEGAVLRIYVNGVEIGSGGTSTASYGSNSNTFKIGEGVLAASGDYFDGRMDDIRVYSRALCPEEIETIYQGGRPAGIRIIEWVETR